MFQNINYITSFVFIISIILVFILAYFYLKKNADLTKKYSLFGGKNTSFGLLFLIISFIILLIPIFDLKWGEKQVKNEISGIDIVFVLDVSKSMNVLDFKDGKYSYSRLDTAKAMISEYITNNRENRFGLVVFAGDAVSISPLTTDYDIFQTFLETVDYRNLSVQGSNFEKAVELGTMRFDDENRSKVMVIISDGGDKDDKIDFQVIKDTIKDKDLSSFVFGVGTLLGGKISTGFDALGRVIYQRYKGEFVESKLNENNLEKLTNSLNGTYFKADSLEKIGDYISNLDKKIIEVASSSSEKIDGTRILAMIGFIFFVLYLIYPIFRRKN